MFTRIVSTLLLVCLPAVPSYAADNGFVGRWKLNGSRTDLSDKMKVDSAGTNKYAFDFGPGVETIVIDGTDQPGVYGTLLSVTPEGPRNWKVVRKLRGRTLITANWTLSEDSKTITDDFTEFGAGDSRLNTLYVYRKDEPAPGFAGHWASVSVTLKSDYVIQVQPWEGDGLSFIDPLAGQTRNVKFDGNDYAQAGPNAGPHTTTSVRRVDERTLELTDKANGKVVDKRVITLSPDLKRLSIATRVSGEPKTLEFDRD